MSDGDGTLSDKERPGKRARTVTRAILVALLLALGAMSALIVWSLMPVSESSELVEFEVFPGWGANRVSEELEDRDLVRSAPVFSAYLRIRGLDRSIGEGLYDLDRAASAPQLAETLVRGGRPRVAQVLLPEGIRATDLAERLEAAGLHQLESYAELISQPGALRPPYLPESATLEGYLFPASYEIPLSDTPQEVVDRLLERFDQEIDKTVREELERSGLSVHEWVILGSMVQSEAGSDEEMPLIAGVFLNRLDLGMPLQSDPTVAYGLGKSLPELDALAGDIRQDHPWNTYTRSDLPRGPISNPGRSALLAVLSPVREDEQGNEYLYFLHGFDDDEIVFRPNINLDDHNQDVARYLRGEGP
ncbi:MAG: endolytic transglycosylase MltG [Trueperaceae bacterium]